MILTFKLIRLTMSTVLLVLSRGTVHVTVTPVLVSQTGGVAVAWLTRSLSVHTLCVGAGYRHLGLIAVLAAGDTGVSGGSETQGERAFRTSAGVLESMIKSLAGQTIL